MWRSAFSASGRSGKSCSNRDGRPGLKRIGSQLGAFTSGRYSLQTPGEFFLALIWQIPGPRIRTWGTCDLCGRIKGGWDKAAKRMSAAVAHPCGKRGNDLQSWRKKFWGLAGWESWCPTLSFAGAKDEGGATPQKWNGSTALTKH